MSGCGRDDLHQPVEEDEGAAEKDTEDPEEGVAVYPRHHASILMS